MSQYSVLIADGSEPFRQALGRELEAYCRVTLCKDGAEVLQYLGREPADVLVTDLMLPGMDGLSLLGAIRSSGRNPAVLAVTPVVSPYILDALSDLGVAKVMEKPCRLDGAVEQVLALLNRNRGDGPEPYSEISRILQFLGFSAKHRGYACLREAVYRMTLDPDRAMVKELYREVGESLGMTGKLTEHAIRCALREAYETGDRQRWQQVRGRDRKGRPTSAVLIRRLARYLQQRQSRSLPAAASDRR